MIRRRILTTALVIIGGVALSSCNLFDSVSEAFNVASVDFSSADPAYTGPTIDGPNVAQAALDYSSYKLSSGLTGKSFNQILGSYYLTLTFHVKADNSKNSGRASFGQTVHPILNFRMNSKNAAPITSTMDPFSVEPGQIGSLDFPVRISILSIYNDQPETVRAIFRGDSIPYFLSGTLKFDLLDISNNSNKGSSTAEVDLATGAIPTRPANGTASELAALGSALF